MRTREEFEREIKFFDDVEDILAKFTLEVLLDIRELLVKVRDQEHVVNFVPPDYEKEDQL